MGWEWILFESPIFPVLTSNRQPVVSSSNRLKKGYVLVLNGISFQIQCEAPPTRPGLPDVAGLPAGMCGAGIRMDSAVHVDAAVDVRSIRLYRLQVFDALRHVDLQW